jgi:hypothetical protein
MFATAGGNLHELMKLVKWIPACYTTRRPKGGERIVVRAEGEKVEF